MPITVLPCKNALWHSWLSYEGSVRSGSIVLISAVGLDNVVDVLVSLVVSPRLLFPTAAIAHQMGSVSIVDQQSDPITPRPAPLHPVPTIKSEPSKRQCTALEVHALGAVPHSPACYPLSLSPHTLPSLLLTLHHIPHLNTHPHTSPLPHHPSPSPTLLQVTCGCCPR